MWLSIPGTSFFRAASLDRLAERTCLDPKQVRASQAT
jgi:hypothetical protein